MVWVLMNSRMCCWEGMSFLLCSGVFRTTAFQVSQNLAGVWEIAVRFETWGGKVSDQKLRPRGN